MPIHSFDDDLFEDSFASRNTQQKKQHNCLISMWKQVYQSIYEIEFDRMSDPSLFVACNDLVRFCKSHSLNMNKYIEWSMKNFNVFSPRRLINDKFLIAFLDSQVPINVSGGYFIIEIGEVVSTVFQEDGQILLDLPSDGKVFVDGKLVHAKRV